MRTKAVKAVAGFAAALLIIGLFTWMVGWGAIADALAGAHPGILLLGGVTAFSGLVALGVAWWIVVSSVAGYALRDGLRVFFATQFANSVTPLGGLGGEPFMAYIVSRDAGIAIEESFGAVLAADLLNTVQFFTLSILGIMTFLVYFPLGPLVSFLLKVILALLLLLGGAFFFLWHHRRWTLALLARAGAATNRAMQVLGVDGDIAERVGPDYFRDKGENFYAVLDDMFQDRRRVAAALAVSHLAGFLWVGGMYLLLLSLGFTAPKSALLIALPASMIAGYLPLPGGLGGIEVAMAGLLHAVAGAATPVASAAALLYRIFTYWAGMMLLGGVAASRMSIDVFSD